MPASPFQAKICGITRAIDLIEAVNAGADAVGLNFYPKSSRYLSAERRDELFDVLGKTEKLPFTLNSPLQTVGVFVNATVGEIQARVDDCLLSAIQLHGDEPPEFLAQLPQLPIVRARRLDEQGLAPIAADIEACRRAGRVPDAVLVDALTPGQYGGTGETLTWAELVDHSKFLGEMPLILAGGLTPENVGDAIRTVRPMGVDTASGVESAPGVKDHEKVKQFVDAAITAFDSI